MNTIARQPNKSRLELHLTCGAMHAAQIPSFVEVCEQVGLKPLLIDLANGEQKQQPMATTWLRGDLAEAKAEAMALAQWLARAGMAVLRVKVEAPIEKAIVGPLLDYDYRAEAARALEAQLGEPSTFPLKIRSAQLLPAMPAKAEHEARIAATKNGPSYMVLLLQYALEPGLGAFTTRTSALLWQDGRSEPTYRAAAIFQTPVGGVARATVLRRLTADDGQVLRGMMRESMTQTLHAVALDLAGARSGPVKTARFNVNGSWVTLAGQSFDERPGCVLFRDQDGALYSVRSAAP